MLTARGVRVAMAVTMLAASPRLLAQQTNEAVSEAKRSFQLGVESYDAHDYREALKSFERSYALSHKLEVLFDIAETQVALGDCRSATQDLDEIVRRGKGSPALVARADARRRELPCATPSPAEVDTPPTIPAAPTVALAPSAPRPLTSTGAAAPSPESAEVVATISRPNRWSGGGWSSLVWGAAGASAACLAAGVVLGVDARASQGRAEAATVWGPDQQREDERGRTLGAAGTALFLAAIVAAATSAVAYVLGRRHPER